jgi:hypothetical protein
MSLTILSRFCPLRQCKEDLHRACAASLEDADTIVISDDEWNFQPHRSHAPVRYPSWILVHVRGYGLGENPLVLFFCIYMLMNNASMRKTFAYVNAMPTSPGEVLWG